MLIWTANCVICDANRATTFAITDTILFLSRNSVSARPYKAIGAIKIKQSTETSISQKYQRKHKISIQVLDLEQQH